MRGWSGLRDGVNIPFYFRALNYSPTKRRRSLTNFVFRFTDNFKRFGYLNNLEWFFFILKYFDRFRILNKKLIYTLLKHERCYLLL